MLALQMVEVALLTMSLGLSTSQSPHAYFRTRRERRIQEASFGPKHNATN
jgi:hypothetical protein